MKKFICCLVALLLCASMTCAAAATEFVPSIDAKDHPEIVPGEDGSIGIIYNGETEIDRVDVGCLVVTPVSKVDTSTEIPDAARATLKDVYAKLLDGSMVLPYEKIDSSLHADAMVIRDLFDATFLCTEHPEMLVPEGVVLELTFDLGVDADEQVYVMTYNDGEWNPIVSVTNNGDGTITCVFEHLCPIAFSVVSDNWSPITGYMDPMMLLWVALMVASAAALMLVVAQRRRNAA
ncbi:MAG: hypothetical protein IJ448_06005 [Oscillospiraceae bacterium]|nr:hypothetical protein [Oscillospiraceae bacterium]